MRRHEYFVYILTNHNKTVLYTGMTNDLTKRLQEHAEKFNPEGFTAKYKCKYLLHWGNCTGKRNQKMAKGKERSID